ncbi:MAG: hypothetical protein WDO69_14860 [Pseudomonadota bacterium]
MFPREGVAQSSWRRGSGGDRTFTVNVARVEQLAPLVRALRYAPRPYGFADQLALPAERGREDVASFLFFMVAIDHDTHRTDARFEAHIDGKLVHGSDLLYLQAARAKRKRRELFLAASFQYLTRAQAVQIFSAPNGLEPADLAGRCDLLRSSARLLSQHYQGSMLAMLDSAEHRLGGNDGLYRRLALFPAYQDPIAKKPNLLAKILLREQLFMPQDLQELHAAIDHVLLTMALRGGIVECTDGRTAELLRAGGELRQDSMLELRQAAAESLSALSQMSGISEDRLDDLFWAYGRESLRQPTPLQDTSRVHSQLDHEVNSAALASFVAFVNGVDAKADRAWSTVRMVKGPFTRYF